MTLSANDSSNKGVLWVQLWGLALTQGAIALMWVIYNLYLVELLTQLGLTRSLAAVLLIVENLLAMVMEPLMGSLSDRWQQQLGTRFPQISLGVILAAGLFLSLPAIVFTGWGAARQWLLPLMAVAWALSMTVFRSPAMSLLGRYAFATRLPQAASILTLVGGVAGAMGPLAGDKILSWGPVAAFGLGSGVLLLAALTLRWTVPNEASTARTVTPITPAVNIDWLSLIWVFGAGVGVTLGFRALMLLFSRVLNQQVLNGNVSLVLGAIFVALAATAIPAGALAVRLGNRRAMVLGLAVLAGVSAVIGTVQSNVIALILAIVFGAAFSLISNGTIPFALSMVPTPKAGLGTGMFFSGGAAASSLFGTIAETLKAGPTGLATTVAVGALLLAGTCVLKAPRLTTTLS